MFGTWAKFLACMVVIGFAGGRLARYGDIIGAKAGWSGSLAGLLLLSTVTSLPELATGISAAGFAGQADIAAGDVFGACVFNLLILALIDLLYRRRPLYRSLAGNHVLPAAFGIALLALTGAALVLGKRLDGAALGHIGIATPLVVLVYLLAMRAILRHDTAHDGDQSAPGRQDTGMRRALLLYAVAAAAVVAAGGWLPFVAMDLAESMAWQHSFVGTLFVAAATTMPELSVAFTALRLGHPDMAVASLLGSNMFNMVVLAFDDAVFRQGPLLAHVAPVHAVTVFAAIGMTALAIAALASRPRRIMGTMSWHGIGMLAVFGLSTLAQYRYAAA